MVGEPLLVAVVASHAVIHQGLVSLLGRHPDRVRVVHFPNHVDPHVVLFDVIDLVDRDNSTLEAVLACTSARILAVSRDLRPDLAARALSAGAQSAVSLGADESELLEAVESSVAPAAEIGDQDPGNRRTGLGGGVGLTRREAQVLTLIAQGRTNREVADLLYLSPNSIKTYVRTAYRKIGATSRTQAVSWAIRHGFPAVGPREH